MPRSVRSLPGLLGAVLALLLMTGIPVNAQPGGSQGGGAPAAGGGPAGGDGAQASGAASDRSGGESGSPSISPGGRAGSPVLSGKDASAAFGAWLASAREASQLSGVVSRLQAIANPSLEAGVPVEAFIARIREAAAKGVRPEVLVQALEEDASRWTWLAGVVRGASWPPDEASPGFYVSTAMAFRNGLDRAAVQGVVVWAAGSRASAEKTGAAMTTAAVIASRLRDPAAGGEIALALARSRLKVGQFPEVVELASKAAASGMSPARFRAALEATVGRGSKLAVFEKALAD
jgi:hypothetical protein